jgi:hypothetical protein
MSTILRLDKAKKLAVTQFQDKMASDTLEAGVLAAEEGRLIRFSVQKYLFKISFAGRWHLYYL